VKLAKSEGEEVLVDWSSDGPSRGIRLLRSGDHFAFQSWPGGAALRSKTLARPERWYHLVVTKTDRLITMYVNGVAEDYHPPAPPFKWLVRPMTFGSDGSGRPSFHGFLDEVAYYPRALTAKEVQDLYMMRESGACKP
jgi:hypothetical protein